MKDRYCKPMFYRGKKISGGAARNARIAAAGGLESIVDAASRAGALAMAQQIFQVPRSENQHPIGN